MKPNKDGGVQREERPPVGRLERGTARAASAADTSNASCPLGAIAMVLLVAAGLGGCRYPGVDDRTGSATCPVGFAREPLSVTPDLPDIHNPDAAWSEGKVLLLHDDQGRIYDVRTATLGASFVVTPKLHGATYCVGIHSGFFVAWQESYRSPWRGRTVGVDGQLGDVRSLPDELSSTVSLATNSGRAIALITRPSNRNRLVEECTLARMVLTPEPGPAQPIADRVDCSLAPREYETADGSSWVAFGKRVAGQPNDGLWLVHVSSVGDVLGRPFRLSRGGPGIVGVELGITMGQDMFFAWVEPDGDDRGHRIAFRRMDRRGSLSAIRYLRDPAAFRSNLVLGLGRVSGKAAALWDATTKARAFDGSGRPAGPEVQLMSQQIFPLQVLPTDGDSIAVWVDERNARKELFIAPLACSGIPSPPLVWAGPIVDRDSTAPTPPQPDSSCPQVTPFVKPYGLPVDTLHEIDAVATVGAETWAVWRQTAPGAPHDQLPSLAMRQIDGPGSEVAAPSIPIFSESNHAGLAVLPRNQLLVVSSARTEVKMVVVTRGAVGAPATISDRLANVEHASVVAGDAGALAFWIAGGDKVVARELDSGLAPGPTWKLGQASRQEVAAAPAPGGYVIAWPTDGAVHVARIAEHRVEWIATEKSAERGDDQHLLAVGLIGSQIYVACHDAAYRFALDGSRLAVVDAWKGLPRYPFAGLVAANGLTVIARHKYGDDEDRDQLCVYRIDAAGRAMGPRICALGRQILPYGVMFPVPHGFYSTTREKEELRIPLRHWRCSP